MSNGVIPDNVVNELIAMDGYDRILSADRYAKQLGMTSEILLSKISQIIEERERPDSSPIESGDEYAQDTSGDTNEAELVVHSARKVADMSRFRLRYAPDDATRQRQSQVNDAVLCPNCSAPLGIPDIRPIKVTCPACHVESLIMS